MWIGGSNRGSVILWGLILCGLIGIATVTAGAYYENFARQARVTRIRSQLTSLESLVRTMAFQPYSYDCGTENGQSEVAAISSCKIRAAYYDSIRTVLMPGAQCANGAPGTCGFRLTAADGVQPGPTLTPNGAVGIFQARITYDGLEAASVRPSDINLTIPTEILQSSKFDCALVDATKPVLVGFRADGSPDCRGFAPVVNGAVGAESGVCPKGTYATVVNFNPLTFNCANLATPDKNVTCGQDQAIGSVTWANGTMSAPCTFLPAAPFNPASAGGGGGGGGPAPVPGPPAPPVGPPAGPPAPPAPPTPPASNTGHWVPFGLSAAPWCSAYGASNTNLSPPPDPCVVGTSCHYLKNIGSSTPGIVNMSCVE